MSMDADQDAWCGGDIRNPEFLLDPSRRAFLRGAGLLMAGMILREAGAGEERGALARSGDKTIVVVIGGVRRAETFSRDGLRNIPHLGGDLFARCLFYQHARNEGVTAHFNAISSIITGNWQRVDDWGKLAPTTPTLFEQFRRERKADRSDAWVVASNKALTSQIGASSAACYGPEYGANVVFPKQLMLAAVVDAMRSGRTAAMADRAKVEAQLESVIAGNNYEGLGWTVFDAAQSLDPRAKATIETAIATLCAAEGRRAGMN